MAYDAMDQSKFKVPQGSPTGGAVPKDILAAWKPQLHTLGCIIDGKIQTYFLADNNMPKDSNMSLTVIAHVLTLASDECLPQQLHIRSDNGAGDAKNQTVFKFAAWLVQKKLFTSVTCGQFRPGHAHFRADQSFATVSLALENVRSERKNSARPFRLR